MMIINWIKRNLEEKRKMKIIKPGEPRQKTCPTCKCVFEYEVSDIQYIPGMTCLNKGTNVVFCPCCNERIDEKVGIAVNSLGHFK